MGVIRQWPNPFFFLHWNVTTYYRHDARTVTRQASPPCRYIMSIRCIVDMHELLTQESRLALLLLLLLLLYVCTGKFTDISEITLRGIGVKLCLYVLLCMSKPFRMCDYAVTLLVSHSLDTKEVFYNIRPNLFIKKLCTVRKLLV
jgi:hypothetical protein